MSIDKQAIYDEVNARFEAELAKGSIPWQKPWITLGFQPRNLQSGKPYRGINLLLLGMSGYDDPRWTTFKAAKNMGGKVRKGERSTLVTLWKRIQVKDEAKNDGSKKVIAILRYFRVFNVEQCDWPEGVLKPLPTVEDRDPVAVKAEAEAVLLDYINSDSELSLRWGGDRACYDPSAHSITLPDREQFLSTEGFYGTAFHEAAHSTGKGLKRELSTTFGSESYAREELTAEMAAAFVCGAVGVDGGFENSVAYIQNWMKSIAKDDKLIMKAAGLAQKAADRILGTTFAEPDSEAVSAPETTPTAV